MTNLYHGLEKDTEIKINVLNKFTIYLAKLYSNSLIKVSSKIKSI